MIKMRAKALKELWYFLYGANPTNFHALLFGLISKADLENRALLRLSFPLEVLVWEEWQSSASQEEFFAELWPAQRHQAHG